MLTCIRGQVWCGSQHENVDGVRELRNPKNDAVEKCRESVSVQLVSKANRVYRWSRRITLLISVSCQHAVDEINISFAAARRFGRLAEAYTSFRQVRCHPFDLFGYWHHPGGKRATGRYTLFTTIPAIDRRSFMFIQLWLFGKSLRNNIRNLFEQNSCEAIPLLWLLTT